jgi:hypothetical protein
MTIRRRLSRPKRARNAVPRRSGSSSTEDPQTALARLLKVSDKK